MQTDTQDIFERKVRESLLDQIERGLTSRTVSATLEAEDEPPDDPREIVFTGDYDQVQDHFVEQGWSDRLPVAPPTIGTGSVSWCYVAECGGEYASA